MIICIHILFNIRLPSILAYKLFEHLPDQKLKSNHFTVSRSSTGILWRPCGFESDIYCNVYCRVRSQNFFIWAKGILSWKSIGGITLFSVCLTVQHTTIGNPFIQFSFTAIFQRRVEHVWFHHCCWKHHRCHRNCRGWLLEAVPRGEADQVVAALSKHQDTALHICSIYQGKH